MSSLCRAFTHLGIDGTKSLALLDNLFLSGAFEPQVLWNSVHKLGSVFGAAGNVAPAAVFSHIHGTMQDAGAYSSRAPHFHPQVLRSKLFVDAKIADVQDAEDFLVYLSQSGYGRSAAQERYELPCNERLRAYEERYVENAKKLGIVDTIPADREAYDETWVLGSIRDAMAERMETLNKSIHNGSAPGKVVLLAGKWELYAEVCGVYNPLTEHLESGGDYLVAMARRYQIGINDAQPLVTHTEEDTAVPGRITGKTYLNYLPEERRRLTEALAARDLAAQFMQKNNIDMVVSETKSETDWRPDTLMTVDNEARRLIMEMHGLGRRRSDKIRQVHIQLVSGQPSGQRQAVLTQRAINVVLDQEGIRDIAVNIHVVGNHAYSTRIEVLQSEEASLIHEYYLTAILGMLRKRPSEALMFRTRDNDTKDVPPLPDAFRRS